MYTNAYSAQCSQTNVALAPKSDRGNRTFALLSLALGSFVIGTSEFASMGILQLFAADFKVDVPTATYAITGYALGVLVGAPSVTLLAARMNRRQLLLALMVVFAIGNLLSALTTSVGLLATARFLTGLPHGAYFGAGVVVASYYYGSSHAGKAFATVMSGLTVSTIFGAPLATFLGQSLGWRETYCIIATGAAISAIALWVCVPRTDALAGNSVRHELGALRKPAAWIMMTVAAVAIASIFAVYTFIGPLVTELAGLKASAVPIALSLFGVGMTIGNIVGGRLADAYPSMGLVLGFSAALIALALLGTFGAIPWILMPCLCAVGFTTFIAIPTIQLKLTGAAPEAPTLMGAMNLAALNVANALGAWSGGVTVASGMGLLSAVWAGFGLTLAGLAIFLISRMFLTARRTSPNAA